ncbi:pyrimidine reductase [Frondihabitans sp. PAMC 28766]|uniref:dihydrofolate reductase family protein n=1 Tax=Frondihabitans sp. PAMC 28766 TaxID=1795630 RepID=UPI00078C058C|nr:dihydrofolate reductase family protein [Frondihabitans sp. PAMC 28766]AMM19000.1 pyrimidine reductase [Frondihabitans sp. PAMC 28766]
MSKVVAVEYVTLDGVFEEPVVGPYFGPELAKFQADNLEEADALLLGRVTYEGFSQAWPQMEAETGEFGVKMNTMPKHVATATLDTLEWNATTLEGDVVTAVTALKADESTGTLLINGSGELFNTLSEAGLIDEYRFMVFPVVVGAGKKLWARRGERALTLRSSVTTETGTVVSTYMPAATPTQAAGPAA